MEIKKFFASFLVLGMLTCNVTYAQDYWVYTPQTVNQTQTIPQQGYYYSNNYYTNNYNDPYNNASYYNSNYYNGQVSTVTTTTTTTTATQNKESFSDRHPVLSAIGVGAVVVGALAAGFLLSDDEPPRHDCPPHKEKRRS